VPIAWSSMARPDMAPKNLASRPRAMYALAHQEKENPQDTREMNHVRTDRNCNAFG